MFNMSNDVVNNAEEEYSFISEIPLNQAYSGPDSEEWLDAMANELKSILKNDTWNTVDRPKNDEVIGIRMVLRNKYKPDGTIERRKARLVARGFNQRPGIYFDQTFAPVARSSSIRLLIALAVYRGMKIHQIDATLRLHT